MTEKDLIARTMRLLDPAPGSPAWGEREIEIASAIPQALRALGIAVANDRNLDGHLTQDYSVTLSSGIGNLAGVNGSVTGVAGEYLYQKVFPLVKDNSGNVLLPMNSYKDFVRPAPTAYGYYLVLNQRIRTRAVNVTVNGPNDVSTAASPITVTAHYVPAAVSNVPDELEEMLIDMLAQTMRDMKTSIAPVAQNYALPWAGMPVNG